MAQILPYKILKPLYFVNTLLGMAPFTIKGKKIQYSKLRVLQTLIYLTTFLTIAVLFFEKERKAVDFIRVKTFSFIALLRIIGNITMMLITFFIIYFSIKKLLEETEKLKKLENELKKIDYDNYIEKSDRKICRFFIIFCVSIQVLINICGGLSTVLSRQKNDYFLPIYIITVYPRLAVSHINLTLYVFVMMLESRFKIINKNISRKIQHSNKVVMYPVINGFCQEIDKIVEIHKSLVGVGETINAIFNPHLLVWITITFVILIGDLYIVIHLIFFHVSGISYIFFIHMGKNIIMYIFDFYFLANCITDLCEEVKSILF